MHACARVSWTLIGGFADVVVLAPGCCQAMRRAQQEKQREKEKAEGGRAASAAAECVCHFSARATQDVLQGALRALCWASRAIWALSRHLVGGR